jgi:tetrapyrrole methylase family protein/MazG family protein
MENKKYTFDFFLQVMERLIAPDGCPWDRVQTHESLKRYLIEECYEAVDAIDNKDSANLCEELGDVMLQVVFHSILAKKEGLFDIDDVIRGVTEKMINRHRHIFGDVNAQTPDEVLKSWEEIKKEEKKYESGTAQLRSIPKSLPALMRSEKVIGKAEKLIDNNKKDDELYTEAVELLNKLKEDKNASQESKMDNIGKILLLIANISRKNEINPEFALTNALETYINKFEINEKNRSFN